MALGAIAFGVVAAACSVQDTLLQATDPDLINPADLATPDGAEALRIGALDRLRASTASGSTNGESTWMLGGLMADEWKSGDTFAERDETDKRNVQYTAGFTSNSVVTLAYRNIHRARAAANQAIVFLRKYRPTPVSNIGQMFFVKGMTELISAENFCNGQPFATFDGANAIPGADITVAQAFTLASQSFDSALAVTTGTDAASVTVQRAARIGKARALMGLGGATNFAAARALITPTLVPTSYRFDMTFVQVSGDNQIWSLNNSQRRYTVADTNDTQVAGGKVKNNLPFVSANDPRVPTFVAPTTGVPALSFDGKTPFVAQGLWRSAGSPAGREDPAAVVAGVDARLMEAEIALSQNDIAGWLGILNALRTTDRPPTLGGNYTLPAALPLLVDPVTPAARVDLQFREKAFWTFGRGIRLGDLRRLIRQYGRTQDQVFPTGPFFKLDAYGTDVNFPVPQAEQNNPLSKGCTDRNA